MLFVGTTIRTIIITGITITDAGAGC